jgi:cytochrome c556
MKRILLSAAAALLVLGLCLPAPTRSQQPKEEVKRKANAWMKTKLELSRHILGGLTEGDFKEISDNAEGLNIATYLEALFGPERADYRQQIRLFEIANQELIRQAKAKNLYGATLAYNQLVASCVQCHQIVRDAKR